MQNSYIDHKYVNLLSSRLPKFKKKGKTTYNFRCILCGDSETSQSKARGYFYEKKGKMLYFCHNCHASMTLGSFLRDHDPQLYKEYSLEKYKDRTSETPLEHDITDTRLPKYRTEGPLASLKKISQLEPFNPVKRYVAGRKIPSDFHYKLFFCPKFKEWVNTLIPGKFDPKDDEPRLIIPFLDREGNCYGFQGRSFKKDGIRYITIILDDSKPKVFGLDTVNFTKPVYVTEGPIDSMFLPNAIAMAGADMNDKLFDGVDKSLITFVYDNEPRNEQIVKKMASAIEKGYNIVIWPESLKSKDINDMVLEGFNPVGMVKEFTYSGMKAKLMWQSWKKI